MWLATTMLKMLFWQEDSKSCLGTWRDAPQDIVINGGVFPAGMGPYES